MRDPWSWRAAGAVAVLAAVYLAARYRLATTPVLAETSYDEALTGLMGLAILRGEMQVFYWGQPYLGAIEGYVAALGFWVAGTSALTLRMTEVLAAFAWVWSVWSITRRIVGEPWALLAGLAVALPPAFLSFAQLSAHGQSLAVTLGALVLATAASLLDPRTSPRMRAAAWVLLGVAAGLGWWASQMMVMFLAAAALALLAARPRDLRASGPYVALGCFAVASLPFWVWNVRHEWATVHHLLSWGDPLPPEWSVRIGSVADTLLRTLRGSLWEGRQVRMPPAAAGLGWLAIWTFYVPGVVLAVVQVGRWVARVGRRRRPWREPLDLVVLAFWLTVVAHATTWFGTSGVLRYAMTFYVTVPVLGAVALGKLARRHRVLVPATAMVAVAVLGYQGATHFLFVRQAAAQPWRPVDAAIAGLTRVGAGACYADSRIAQVITFESGGRIVCADYLGLRNYAFLQAVDAIDDPGAVAIVTHGRLENPPPRVMTAALRRIGAEAHVEKVGDYEIFHHLRPPVTPVRPISTEGWRATASTRPEDARLAFDRKVWTRWNARQPRGAWLQVDLGRVHRVAGLTLLTEPQDDEAPGSLRIEASVDGRIWDLVNDDRELLSGVHWWKGHPRIDEGGRVIVRMAPHSARYVRFLHLDMPPRRGEWGISELFVYEEADRAWAPLPAAAVALGEARDALSHWMDDPGGPHPRRAPVTYAHRRAQVPWSTVFAAANRAIAAAPDWEEAHELYGSALDLSGWDQRPDRAVQQAWEDRAWGEVLRWADVADAEQPGFWRSGRALARADALEGLGRPGEAAAVRAAVAGRPPTPLHLQFGGELELAAVDVPSWARRGDALPVGWTWRALRFMREDHVVLLHWDPVAAGGHAAETRTLGGYFGTTAWRPGERVDERLALRVPPDLVPGVYHLRVAVRRPDATGRLRLDPHGHPGAGRYTATIGTLTIAP